MPDARAPGRRPTRFLSFWFAPAWGLLGIARILLSLVPFRRVARWCGVNQGPSAWIPLATQRQRQRARQIRHVVECAAARTPWRSDCLPQALAASALLRFYDVPHAVCLGLARGTDAPWDAHAWVDAAGVAVCGGRAFETHTVVACFIHED